jgi:hypothetical protein
MQDHQESEEEHQKEVEVVVLLHQVQFATTKWCTSLSSPPLLLHRWTLIFNKADGLVNEVTRDAFRWRWYEPFGEMSRSMFSKFFIPFLNSVYASPCQTNTL